MPKFRLLFRSHLMWDSLSWEPAGASELCTPPVNGGAKLVRSFLLLKTSQISCNCLRGGVEFNRKKHRNLAAHPGDVLC